MKSLIFLFFVFILACGGKSLEPPNLDTSGIVYQKPSIPYEDTVWDISDIATTREQRINFSLNQDTAYNHLEKGYDGRLRVYETGVRISDTLWFLNGEKENLFKKVKILSVEYPNTYFCIISFAVKQLSEKEWKKVPGYSLWYKQL